MAKSKIDVWYGEGIMHWEGGTLDEGKRRMKTLRKQGKESIRMYVQYDNGKRWYYSFDKDGKITKETNNLDN